MSGQAQRPHPVARTYNHLVGWSCLALGMGMIAALVLTPVWMELKYAQWERGFIELCRDRQQASVDAHEQFASALQANDPVLLERVAYEQLRVKPAKGTIVKLPEVLASTWKARQAELGFGGDGAPVEPMPASLIEQWLHYPQPVVGVDYPSYVEPTNLLIRLATGPRRLLLLGLAGVFILCGLMFPGPLPKAVETDATAAVDDEDDESVIVGEIDREEDELLHVAA